MLLTHITYDRFIKIITGDLYRCADNSTAQRDHSDICSTTTDIHDHISARSGNINTGSDSCCDRLLNNKYFSCACLISSILNCLLLYLSNTARYADSDLRLTERLLSNCLLNKMIQHLFRYREIRDHSLTQRTDCHDIARCTAKHQTRFLSDRFNSICISVECNDRRLFQYNALPFDINKDAGCSQVNSNISSCHIRFPFRSFPKQVYLK